MRPCYLRTQPRTQPRANEPQNRTFCAPWLCRTPYRQAAHTRRSARVSGYRAGRYLLSVTAPVQLERCHPADPGRRAREAAAAAHKLTVLADFNAGDPPRGGFAARAVLHDSPATSSGQRAPGTPELSGSRGTADSGGWERNGNHQRSRWLQRAPSRSPVRGFTCGNTVMTW